MNNGSKHEITPVQLMFSSCTGAILTSVIVTPLDVVKIRIQAQQKEFLQRKCFLYCNGLMEHICFCNGNGTASSAARLHGSAVVPPYKWFKRPGHFNGTLDAFSKIVRNEGLSSLWSGLPPTLVMAIPATMVYFTMYDQLRSALCRGMSYGESPPLWVPTLTGGIARTLAATTISPLELIRTKMQSQKLTYWKVNGFLKDSIKSQGILSLWSGLGPTILRDVPFSAIYWLNYEFYKKAFNQPTPSFAFSFVTGAAAGTVAAVITLPFDVVKTHRQIELGEAIESRSKKDTKTVNMLKNIYSQRGIGGLFAGIVPRVVKVAPACAIMISTYEFGKSYFRQLNGSGKTFVRFLVEGP